MGGNVVFGSDAAERIDLNKIDRTELVRSISLSMGKFSDAFKKQHGFAIWEHGIQEYLSGSTDSLFDKKITDEDYKKVKPSLGDIDTQIDGNLEKEIRDFLNLNIGKTFGDFTLINHKSSVKTIVSLWRYNKAGLNVQIDLEMVSFVNGRPTPWAKFSFSSSWQDMTIGIKGIAHKYIFRAITAIWNKDVVIQMKTKKKEVTTSHLSFSNFGLRTKLEPVHADGKHVHEAGKPVYKELDTAETGFDTEFESIFKTLFNAKPKKAELAKLNSYIGILDLCKHYHKGNLKLIANGMANLLFGGSGSGGQLIYSRDLVRDKAEKLVILHYMAKEFGLDPDSWNRLIEEYYKSHG